MDMGRSIGTRNTSSKLLFVAALLSCSACESNNGEADGADGSETETNGVVEGDEVRGGALYDNWWIVTGQDEPSGDHPLWASRPDTQSNERSGAVTWRCNECHGWDYVGVEGAYGAGNHRTGFLGILRTQKGEAELIELLSDPKGHAYGEVLDEQSLADLAAFVANGTIDTTSLIAIDGSFMGEAAIGQAMFENICSGCHGSDGLTRPPGADEGFEDFPGFVANANPQEFLHKVRFGQPGTAMPPQANQLSNDALAGLGAYAQTLPQMHGGN
jgi:mono/diheme cytochrome c family protein